MKRDRTEPFFTDRQEKGFLRAAASAVHTQHPNPERIGCPEPGAVQSLATRRISLKDTGDLVDHVATCAPCFAAYTRHRRQRRLARLGATVLAGAAGLLAVVLWWAHVSRPVPTQPHQADEAALSIRSATLDVRVFSTTRSAVPRDVDGPAPPHLQNEYLALAILLPIGMDDGEYLIEVRNKSGEAVAHATGTARSDGDAERLATRIDLRRLSPGRYRVALRTGASSWWDYPVDVEGRR